MPEPSARDAADLLTLVSRRLQRRTAGALVPVGVTLAQTRVLRVLSRAGRPLRMGELAERLDVVPRSATSLVDALEESGLVVRQPAVRDRRATTVSLTPAGSGVLVAVRRVRRRVAGQLLAPLDAAQREQLRELLAIVADG